MTKPQKTKWINHKSKHNLTHLCELKQTTHRISNHHRLLFGLILLLWLLFELIFCCYLGFCFFFCWVKWIEFIRIKVFKNYFKVFKILFKGIQHLYNTYIIFFFFPFAFNNSAHPHHNVTQPLITGLVLSCHNAKKDVPLV